MKTVSQKAKPSRMKRCVNCRARDREAGHKLCMPCLERMRRSQAERRKRWRKEGLCIYCGRARESGLTCCARCREQKRLRNARRG